MNEAELAECYAVLGVAPGVTTEELERVYMRLNFALIKAGSAEGGTARDEERQRLRRAYTALSAHLKAEAEKSRAAAGPGRRSPRLSAAAAAGGIRAAGEDRPAAAAKAAPTQATPAAPAWPGSGRKLAVTPEGFALFAFDNWLVNLVVPPLLLALAWVVTVSPLGFLLKGFHVWMHELGHASAAWMTGRKATPLPFGWTPVEDEFSWFVYGGVLFLFAVLFVAGWRERKVWPMVAAVGLAALQAYMTFRLTPARQEFWWGAFGGVGGEFYLSTLFMLFFWVQMPEKFRWGACRYVVFLLSASAFLSIWLMWQQVYRGLEEIPFGTMINGEEDAGGDMNRLMDDYGWSKHDIRRYYRLLGIGCWVALGLMYAIFALGLNRVADRVLGALGGGRGEGG